MSEPVETLPPFGGEDAAAPLSRAAAAVLPVPYERTVSYGAGASRGPGAILRASTQVELFDEEMRVEPYRIGVHTEPALPVTNADPPERVVEVVERRFGELMDAGSWVVMLGGEHSITPGGVRAAARRHPGLVVVQLDAHADLRDRYEGTRFSHACAMARSLEVAEVRALGIRSYSVEEFRTMGTLDRYRVVHAREMASAEKLEWLLDDLAGRPVYLTVDVDYFDPALIPSTGTPEPGGGQWRPTLAFLDDLFSLADVVGCDVVELAPVPGIHHPDFTAARLVYKLIGMRFRDALAAGG